jgi:hypothetical protein
MVHAGDNPWSAVARPALNRGGKRILHQADLHVTWEVVEVEVTNRTGRSLTLASYPARLKQDWTDKSGGGSGEGGPSKVTPSPYPFTLVGPKASLRFRIYLPIEMMAPGAMPHLTLEYLANVGPRNKDAWIGTIRANVVSNKG